MFVRVAKETAFYFNSLAKDLSCKLLAVSNKL